VSYIDQALEVLVVAFPANKAGPETVEVYALMLADIPPADLARAVAWCLANYKFFPTVAEVRAAALAASALQVPDMDQAWLAVKREVSRTGYYGAPHFDHPAIAAAVQAMGWREICLEEELVVRAHFFRVYESVARRTREEVLALPPAGVAALSAKLGAYLALPEGR